MDLNFLVALLPIAFMLHDFEEIIFFKPWLKKNEDILLSRFPVLSRHILPHFKKISTSGFALAVAEQFVLLSLITYTSIWIESYYVWFAVFMAFSIHLIIHVFQWMVFRKYIPTIITSILILPYCIYTFMEFIKAKILSINEIFIWTIIGITMMLVNLAIAHRLALKFSVWVSK